MRINKSLPQRPAPCGLFFASIPPLEPTSTPRHIPTGCRCNRQQEQTPSCGCERQSIKHLIWKSQPKAPLHTIKPAHQSPRYKEQRCADAAHNATEHPPALWAGQEDLQQDFHGHMMPIENKHDQTGGSQHAQTVAPRPTVCIRHLRHRWASNCHMGMACGVGKATNGSLIKQIVSFIY